MIRVIPPPLDYGVNTQAWNEVVEALNAAGLSALLERPVEQRGAPTEAVAIGVFVASYVGTEVLNVIRNALMAKLRGVRRLGEKRGEPRRIPILGPDENVLMWVEVPSEPDPSE